MAGSIHVFTFLTSHDQVASSMPNRPCGFRKTCSPGSAAASAAWVGARNLFSGERPLGAAALEAGETGSSSSAFGVDTLLLPRACAGRSEVERGAAFTPLHCGMGRGLC